jgi:hypothetical protein
MYNAVFSSFRISSKFVVIVEIKEFATLQKDNSISSGGSSRRIPLKMLVLIEGIVAPTEEAVTSCLITG